MSEGSSGCVYVSPLPWGDDGCLLAWIPQQSTSSMEHSGLPKIRVKLQAVGAKQPLVSELLSVQPLQPGLRPSTVSSSQS